MRNPFRRAAAEFVASRTGFDAARLPVSLPPEHAKGDYAVGCFPPAKALKKNPAQLAKEIAEAFAPGNGLAAAEAAGPFVNFTVDRCALAKRVLADAGADGWGRTDSGAGKTVVIDFSHPNIA